MRFLLFALLGMSVVSHLHGTEDLEQEFAESIRPFLNTYCVACHNAENSEGDLNLDDSNSLSSVVTDFRRWQTVMDRLEAGEMPPDDAKIHPPAKQRKHVVHWIADVRRIEAERRSGDPGIVLARRLSNAEYDNTIRDLIGVDLEPAKDFPVDPANQEGFDNSGESLTMSPALLVKHLEATRFVAEHLVLTPTGIEFAPHPVMTETDRDKYCVNRIIDFYNRQRTDYSDFFFALWQFQHRRVLGLSDAVTLEQFASDQALSPRYLVLLAEMLDRQNDVANEVGPIAALRIIWSQMPTGGNRIDVAMAREHCERMSDFVISLRKRLVPKVENLTTPEVHNGSQPLVLWKNRQFAANRRRYAGGAFQMDDLGLKAGTLEAIAMSAPEDDDQREQFEQTFHEFCSTFPDAFFVSQRARVYLDPEKEKERTGRLLSAGFHSQMGYFRDDAPLCDLILSDAEREELDRLWLELDFVTSAPMRQYAGFIWFDRTDSSFMRDSQFNRFRAEDKDCTSQAKVRALKKAYLSKAASVGGNPQALEAIQHYFDEMSRTFREMGNLKVDSRGAQVNALVRFAERAFRRPLPMEQRQEIRAFYQRLLDEDRLSHEDAMRDSTVAILMSPKFCYRLDLPRHDAGDEGFRSVRPLDGHAVASRLSYFLWSSMPDQELLDLAASGKLIESEVLKTQVRRMLRDRRVLGFIREFAGNWLGFRRFEQHNAVDRNRFPRFTDELRRAMYEEPIRLFSEIIRTDGSILDFLDADYTFVNDALATHYGIPIDRVGDSLDGWRKVDGANQFGRGGLLPMAVFLTANSPGLRTSPVKRGNWVVRQILGEQIPAPPATVPELPGDESKLGDLTLRQTLERHRANPSCAACHDRIDSFGLVFEKYGPIGERRTQDMGGRQIDSHAMFPDSSHGEGIEGLREYIRRERQSDFTDNFCRKLLAYGLGRSLQLSDEPAIAQMKSKLARDDYRFGGLMEMIVTSEAFLNKRTRSDSQ